MEAMINSWKGWRLRMYHRVFWDGDGILPYARWLDRGSDFVEVTDLLQNKTEEGYKINWLSVGYDGSISPRTIRYPFPKVLSISEDTIEGSILNCSFTLKKGGPGYSLMDGDCGGAEKTNDYYMNLLAPDQDLSYNLPGLD